mmetsp:Transcript_38719/g.96981  ORF Transcript_38719/g.96981 Transcript_38719/m.96981 type:complete len:236 (+) Transcript_38719:211-918(+)
MVLRGARADAALTAAVLCSLLLPCSPQSTQEIGQGQYIRVGEDVRELRNIDTHRAYTVAALVGFSVEFEEDTLSGARWILDLSQAGDGIEVLPTTTSDGLTPARRSVMVESEVFSRAKAAHMNPIADLKRSSFAGSIIDSQRRDAAAWQHLNRQSTGLAYEGSGHYEKVLLDTAYGADGNPVYEPGANSVWRRYDFKTLKRGTNPRLVWRYMQAGDISPETRNIPLDFVMEIEIG